MAKNTPKKTQSLKDSKELPQNPLKKSLKQKSSDKPYPNAPQNPQKSFQNNSPTPPKIKIPKKPTLRILGGIYKGKSLQMADLEITRSSKAILKESFFNTLGAALGGVNFIEFFAGSGSIGIEALSRGAKNTIFFENNQASYRTLTQNLKSLQITAYKAYFGDTFKLYPTLLETFKSPCIAYLDPPFDFRDNAQGIYQKCFAMIEHFNPDIFKIIALEHYFNLEIPHFIGDFCLHKTKKFGKSALSYFYVAES